MMSAFPSMQISWVCLNWVLGEQHCNYSIGWFEEMLYSNKEKLVVVFSS